VPLLKYAKEVRTRLRECLDELSGIEIKFMAVDPRLRKFGQEFEVDTRVNAAGANMGLVGKGYDPDSSFDSAEAMDGLGRII
jgi:hypothetical protein